MITFIIKAGVVSQSLICRTRTKDQKLGCGSLLTFHFYPFSLNIRRTFAILDQMTRKSKFNSRIRPPNRIKIQTSNPRREQGTIRWDPIRKIMDNRSAKLVFRGAPKQPKDCHKTDGSSSSIALQDVFK